jgi:hypothetical protein
MAEMEYDIDSHVMKFVGVVEEDVVVEHVSTVER